MTAGNLMTVHLGDGLPDAKKRTLIDEWWERRGLANRYRSLDEVRKRIVECRDNAALNSFTVVIHVRRYRVTR